jgi:outer membrane receptor protein involved in Fe transport
MAYDLELWYNKSKNYSARGVVSSGPSGTVTSFLNLPLEADQIGFTASIQQELSDRLDLRYFFTLQETQLDDVYASLSSLSNPEDRRHQATPTWYGGFIVNYDIADDWYLNVNATFTEGRSFVRFREVRGDTDNIYLVNAKLAYQYDDNITLYAAGKNLFDTEKNEFAWTDRGEMSILFGFDFRPDI